MLSDLEKEKLKSEEVFRFEVRKSLEVKPKDNSTFWKFLNSSFGIFILSTIIVGGFSFTYKEWQNNVRNAETEKIETREKNNIRNRLRQETLVRLELIIKLKRGAKLYESLNVWIAYWGSSIKYEKKLPFKYYNSRSLFSKYESWTLFEVLAELNNYEEDTLSLVIDKTARLMHENFDYLNGGEYLKTKTNTGEFLPKGKYNSKSNEYTTTENKIIRITPNELPLVNYFFAHEKLGELMGNIEELKHLLTLAKKNKCCEG